MGDGRGGVLPTPPPVSKVRHTDSRPPCTLKRSVLVSSVQLFVQVFLLSVIAILSLPTLAPLPTLLNV